MNKAKIEQYRDYCFHQYSKAFQFFSPYVTSVSWSADKMAKHSLTVSGSKIGAIVGHCKYRTPLDVFLDMTLQRAPFAGNYKTRRGQAMEHEIAYEASEILHGTLGGGMELVHPDFNGFTCQIDETMKSEVLGVIICECKWISYASDEWGKGSNIDAGGNIIEEDSQIPQDYHDQVMWQLGIINAVYTDKAPKMAILSAVIKNEPQPRIYVIHYDENAFYELMAKAETFLFDNVIANQAPEMSESDIKALEDAQKKQKTVEGDYLSLEGTQEKELLELANKYKETAFQISELTALKDLLKEKMVAIIGTHEGVTSHDGTLIATYKSTKSKVKFNEKLFAQDNPSLYQQYSEIVDGSRIFSNKL